MVFVGLVEKTDPRSEENRWFVEQTAWVRVMEPFKGVLREEVIQLWGQSSSCYAGYREGATMLFYLKPSEKPGKWSAGACGRTDWVTNAIDDLSFLRGLPSSADGNRVSGTISLYEDDPVQGFRRVRWLAGVRVRAEGPSGSYATSTSAEGLYEFRNLQPGSYVIKVDPPKSARLRYPIAYGRIRPPNVSPKTPAEATRLEVTATSGNGFDFVFSSDTLITGHVLGPDGRCLKGVCVELDPVQTAANARSRFFDCTESDGTFSLKMMPPGSYRLVANSDGQMSAAAPFGRLYYPGTSEIQRAQIIAVEAGQHVEGIELRVPSLARLIALRGRLVFNDGVPLPGQSVEFRSEGRQPEYGRTNADGSFLMHVLAGQSGALTAQILVWRGQENDCPQFNAKFRPGGHAAALTAAPYPVAGDRDLSDIEVRFPVLSCDAWIKRELERQ